jgi:nitrogen fixation/metabolism regulation signal transduction histidine kinase
MAFKKRRNVLINRPFQMRFSFYVCSWLFVLSLIYPMIIYNLFDYFLQRASQNPFGPAVSEIAIARTEMIRWLVLMQVLFLSVTFVVSILISHRIAGPLYKLKLFLEKARDGQFWDQLNFRNYDHFQDLARSFNDMTDGIRATLAKRESLANSAATDLRKALDGISEPSARKEVEKALATLKEIQKNP